MTHEEAEIAVLQKLETYTAELIKSPDPHFSEWAGHWAGRFYRGRIQREFIMGRRAQRKRTGHRSPFADSYR